MTSFDRSLRQNPADSSALVYCAGVDWDAPKGTDRHLVEALARIVPVLWVDPPASLYRRRAAVVRSRLTRPAPGVVRLQTAGPPGLTRPGLRRLTELAQDRHVRRICADRSLRGVVVANPIRTFPAGLAGPSLLYVTDDWVAGAPLMGLSQSLVRAVVTANVARAGLVAAVSPGLQRSVVALGATSVALLPNGCDVPDHPVFTTDRTIEASPTDLVPPSRSPAGLVGQLNERLDLASLEAVSDSGVPVLVVGPRTDRDPAFGTKLSAWLRRDGVTWLGGRPAEELPMLFARMSVGLTPYVDSAFNRASFPLKTLEYLAHGLPVVASDLPAVRWLGSPHIDSATSAESFASLVRSRWLAQSQETIAGRVARQDFARRHDWGHRAEALLTLLTGAPGAAAVRTSVGA